MLKFIRKLELLKTKLVGDNTMLTVEQQRQKQLEDNIPEIWSYNTILYIGACMKRFHFKDALKNSGGVVDIVEIDKHRASDLASEYKWINTIHCGDIRTIAAINNYDLVFWSHGPEMIPRLDVDSTIEKLLSLTNELTVLMSPWGVYHYRSGYNSKYMNVSSLYEEDFENLDFKTSTLGDKNVNGSNLLAWKYK